MKSLSETIGVKRHPSFIHILNFLVQVELVSSMFHNNLLSILQILGPYTEKNIFLTSFLFISQESKPTFKDFYKSLGGDMGYTPTTLYEYYKLYMNIPHMTIEKFMQLDEIHKYFKVEMVSRNILLCLTVFRKRI